MRIDHLSLKNYRCFVELSVDLHPQLTVIVAPNGLGKSTLLDAIKIALWPYVAGFDMGSTTNDITGIHNDDVRREQVQSHEMEWRLPAQISADGQLHVRQLVLDGVLKNPKPQPENGMVDMAEEFHEDVAWQGLRYRESVKKGTKTKDVISTSALNLNETAKALEQRIFSGKLTKPDDLPMLGYYGTGRLWSQKKLTASFGETDSETQSRTFAYRDCLDPASSYKHFAVWFSRVHQSYLQAQIRNYEKRLPANADVPYGLIAPFKAVQCALDAVLKNHTGWHTLEYSAEHQELVLNHDQHGELKVSQLSDGIRNMLAMVGDIAYRCYKLNVHCGEAAPQRTRGIVMIDEIDMHLHPSWQQTVLNDLIAAFPKLQFIVTTHSPQVLSTVNRDHIRVLRHTPQGHEAAIPDFSPLAHESGDALAKIMETHREPELPLQESIRDYEQWVRIGQENSPEARQLRQTLDEAGYQIHDSDLTTWRFLAQRRTAKGD